MLPSPDREAALKVKCIALLVPVTFFAALEIIVVNHEAPLKSRPYAVKACGTMVTREATLPWVILPAMCGRHRRLVGIVGMCG